MRLHSPPDVATLFPGKQKPQESKVAATYLGDSLLVSHDSLLDECVHFNISIPARHHHPGPAKTHRDFHGLVSEILPRFGVKPRRAGGGEIRVEIKEEHGFLFALLRGCLGIPLQKRGLKVFPLLPAGRHCFLCAFRPPV